LFGLQMCEPIFNIDRSAVFASFDFKKVLLFLQKTPRIRTPENMPMAKSRFHDRLERLGHYYSMIFRQGKLKMIFF